MAEETTIIQERYRALMQAAKSLISCTDLDAIVDNLLRHSINMMQAETCSMLLPDFSSKELIIYSARGEVDRGIHTSRIPWNKGIAGHVFHQKKAECVDNVQQDPRFLPILDQRTGFKTRSMLCLPLLEDEKCLGVVQAINSLHSPTFTQLDQEIFEGMAGLLTSALVRLENQHLREHESRLQQEMELAHEIQKSYLPPSSTQLARSEINVHYQSARALGGDFYAVIPLARNAVLFAVGDVSGKGIPAALTTAQVMGAINALTGHAEKNLTTLVLTLNQHLCSRLYGGRFVATTFLLYEPELDEMEILCAGQLAPWRWDGFTWSQVDVRSSLPLGVIEKYPYTSAKVKTFPGERWLLSSDGINEGRNRQEQEYGLEQLRNSLGIGLSDQVLHHAWNSWLRFVDSDHLHDDACLGILSCTPSANLRVLSGAENCKSIRAFIEAWGMQAGLDDLKRGEIVLAIDEAFTNILKHAYNHTPGHFIDLSATLDRESLTFKLRDYGSPFPEKIPDRNLQTIRPGGLGIPILRRVFCQVTYLPQECGTELKLVKILSPSERVV